MIRSLQTIIRRAPGSYVRGAWTAGAASLHVIRASVQPVAGVDAAALPEGKRAQDAIKIYTSFAVQAGSEETGMPPDRINWRESAYECLSVEPWQSGVVPHFKAIFHRVGAAQ
ncbi:MAG: hypothetical protein ACTHKB_00665 [Burkholderiaceae bacterium]